MSPQVLQMLFLPGFLPIWKLVIPLLQILLRIICVRIVFVFLFVLLLLNEALFHEFVLLCLLLGQLLLVLDLVDQLLNIVGVHLDLL